MMRQKGIRAIVLEISGASLDIALWLTLNHRACLACNTVPPEYAFNVKLRGENVLFRGRFFEGGRTGAKDDR